MAALHLLEDAAIKAAKPQEKLVSMHDGGGLYLYVRPSGLKSWVFIKKLNNQRIEVNLGSYPDRSRGIDPGVPLRVARIEAGRLRDKIQAGINPIEEARQQEAQAKQEAERRAREAERPQTVRELFSRWKSAELEHQRDGNGEIVRRGHKDEGVEIERAFTKDVFPVIGDMRPGEVEPVHIFAIRDRMMKRGVGRMANVCLTNMRQMFVYAFKRRFCLADPTYQIKKQEFGGFEKPRKRWLTDPEITDLATRLVHRAPGHRPLTRPNQITLLLLLSTGCRIGELTQSRWEDVNLKQRSFHIPKKIRKSNRNHPASDHDVYLSDLSVALLTELQRFTGHTAWLFPNREGTGHLNEKTLNKQVADRQTAKQLKGRAKGCSNLELEGGEWIPHDLRRTASTLIVRLATQQKFSKDSAELLSAKVRSHMDPNPLARVYEHYTYDEEMQKAWVALGSHLETLLPADVLKPWPLPQSKKQGTAKSGITCDARLTTPSTRQIADAAA